ncbi:hypothetical protein IP84_04250 [beta proteobacterium AAP99]|nr:hypothetical protein IP84_04250 [beta proteobacterium AAP99]
MQREVEVLYARQLTLERSLAVLYPDAAGESIAPITPFRHGKRGDLSRFLLGLIQQAGPDGLDTPTLARRCAEEFAIPIEGIGRLNTYARDIVRSRLRDLSEQGRVELMGYDHRGRARWRLPQTASLDELRRQTQVLSE